MTLFDRLRWGANPGNKEDAARAAEEAAALQHELAEARQAVSRLQARVLLAKQRAGAQLTAQCRRTSERARLAGMPVARLGTDSLILEGPSRRRLAVERVSIGDAVVHSVTSRLGVVESATTNPRVQALWDRLQGSETKPDDERLAGQPSTALDVPGAAVRLEDDGRTLRVSMHATGHGAPDGRLPAAVAIPKFTFDFPQRKLSNFGHWLLDCVPQVVALSAIEPAARFLLPAPLRGFQRATLELVGLPAEQAVAWDGASLECERLLVFESDGRAGGRPLSALLETRRRLASRGITAERTGTRRIYVSRRDAAPQRRWVANEPEVEALFASLGFEVLVMADTPLAEQIAIFREAAVVAGISGAGLSDIIFAAPDTHVVVLLSDNLMSWYADHGGARSNWIRTAGAPGRRLSTLGDSPHFYVHLAAAFGQHCHCFLGNDEMPLEALAAFLDRVLGRVDA